MKTELIFTKSGMASKNKQINKNRKNTLRIQYVNIESILVLKLGSLKADPFIKEHMQDSGGIRIGKEKGLCKDVLNDVYPQSDPMRDPECKCHLSIVSLFLRQKSEAFVGLYYHLIADLGGSTFAGGGSNL